MSTVPLLEPPELSGPHRGWRPEGLADATRDEAGLHRFLRGLPRVEEVGLQRRSRSSADRRLTRGTRAWAIDAAVGMVVLSTPAGDDTVGSTRAACSRARRPDPGLADVPAVAAVRVAPDLVRTAVLALRGSAVGVSTPLPAGRPGAAARLADTEQVLQAGAADVELALDRATLLAGRYGQLLDEVTAVAAACEDARLTVRVDVDGLTGDQVRRASWIALLGGADLLAPRSSARVRAAAGHDPAAPAAVHVALQAVRDLHAATGERRGVASGAGSAPAALAHLVAVNETVGPRWLQPDLVRFDSPDLLTDLLLHRRGARP